MPIEVLLAVLIVAVLAVAGASWFSVRKLKTRVAKLEEPLEPATAHTPAPKIALIINPSKNNADAAETSLREACAAHGFDEPLVLTTTEDDPGRTMAQEALAAGCDLLLAAGGDGTVREVAEVLAGDPKAEVPLPSGAPGEGAEPHAGAGGDGTPPPSPREVTLGIIPLGTGNLLARNLDIPVDDMDAALTLALFGPQRGVDAVAMRLELADGTVQDHVYLVMAGIGMDADVMGDTRAQLKKTVGPLAYAEAGVRHLPGRRRTVSISLDDGPAQQRRIRSVVFANCGRLQAGLDFVPDARIDDGKLDLVVMSPRSVGGWLAIAAKTLMRHKGSIPVIDYYQARKVRLSAPEPISSQLDGDTTGDVLGLTARILPKALQVRAPRPS